ncbi:hypothetical protein [Streptomyces sp. 8K308]|uniref:hypothetical protein n=1 Tax=Streptomyces sp. 8K308 TaxID=2530388 RepID=UPI001404FF7D|nr:hypothetical protein [Streptomyces sp. 8K308]
MRAVMLRQVLQDQALYALEWQARIARWREENPEGSVEELLTYVDSFVASARHELIRGWMATDRMSEQEATDFTDEYLRRSGVDGLALRTWEEGPRPYVQCPLPNRGQTLG